MQQRHRFSGSHGGRITNVRQMYRGGKQHFARTCPPAELSGEMRGIAHQRERRPFGDAEDSDRNFAAMNPDADSGIDRIFFLPGRSDVREALLNRARGRQGFVDLRVARISDAKSCHHVGSGQVKYLTAAFQNCAGQDGEEFLQQ